MTARCLCCGLRPISTAIGCCGLCASGSAPDCEGCRLLRAEVSTRARERATPVLRECRAAKLRGDAEWERLAQALGLPEETPDARQPAVHPAHHPLPAGSPRGADPDVAGRGSAGRAAGRPEPSPRWIPRVLLVLGLCVGAGWLCCWVLECICQ